MIKKNFVNNIIAQLLFLLKFQLNFKNNIITTKFKIILTIIFKLNNI